MGVFVLTRNVGLYNVIQKIASANNILEERLIYCKPLCLDSIYYKDPRGTLLKVNY